MKLTCNVHQHDQNYALLFNVLRRYLQACLEYVVILVMLFILLPHIIALQSRSHSIRFTLQDGIHA